MAADKRGQIEVFARIIAYYYTNDFLSFLISSQLQRPCETVFQVGF